MNSLPFRIAVFAAAIWLVQGCSDGRKIDKGEVSLIAPVSVERSGTEPVNPAEAERTTLTAAPASPEPTSQQESALYLRLRDQSQAGDADASFELGMLHLMGKEGATRDRALALDLLRQAADRGHPRAISNLGSLLLDPDTGSRDEALALYERAARQGDLDAMRHAAFVLAYQPDGVSLVESKVRIERALGFLREAVGKGDVFSEAALGALLADLGDIREAAMILRKPALEGIVQAVDRLSVIVETNPDLVDQKTVAHLKSIQERMRQG